VTVIMGQISGRAVALAALCLGAASGGSGSAPRPVRATVGRATLELRQVTWERSARVRPGSAERPAALLRDEATARFRFALGARSGDELARYVEPASRFRAVDDAGRRHDAITARMTHSLTGVFLEIVVAGQRPQTGALRQLKGGLRAYPRARRIRFHIPWLKDETPVQARYGGAVTTLTRFRLVGDDSTLWVRFRPPPGFAAPRLHGGLPFTARAYEVNGNLVNNGGITEIRQTRAGAEPEYRFYAPKMRRTPSRLQVEMSFVAGRPAVQAFSIGPLPLPAGRE